jgi:two-component system phosphate regulon sensor histidine kinase PhoR
MKANRGAMQLNRTYLYIILSSAALVIVLIIQVNWLLQTARIKEEMFNEKANMVLSRTTEALGADKETCGKIEASLEPGSEGAAVQLGQEEKHKIDSLFNHYMRFYNFHIDYSFVVAKPDHFNVATGGGLKNFIYNKRLNENVVNNGIELKLIFPEKKQYIIAEMGTLFITSVVLILVVLVLFWRTILSLLKKKKVLEQTTDFLNNMTHQFNTPLTNIGLAGRMILKDTNIKQEEKIKHYSGIILEENEKLKQQVEQVLGMTALEKGEIPLQKTELDFHKLIRDSLNCMSMQLENKEGKIDLRPDAKKFMVRGDSTHLTNALCNLVDNAIKYSGKGAEISVHTNNIERSLVVSVSEKGPGIEKEYQEKVFEKYFRVPAGDVHNVKGFGLGLAYTKKIIELHGGKIELQSETGMGTTFTITLPNAY